MAFLPISEVARQVGVRPSAIRYYEKIGILLPPPRIGGQRRYDDTALYRLAVIQQARRVGFTLDEIRELFFGFRRDALPSERWRKLSRRKLEELARLVEGIKAIQAVLQDAGKCHCVTLDECGKRLFQKSCRDTGLPPRTKIPRPTWNGY